MEDIWLIFDFGKTNKKAFLFNQELAVCATFHDEIPEQPLEDGMRADDVEAMTQWAQEILREVTADHRWRLRGVNFTTFGATVAHLDAQGELACPVYSYTSEPGAAFDARFAEWMRKLPEGPARLATPLLPQFLIAAKQLFWLREKAAMVAARIRKSLFLPQYFLYRFTGQRCTEPTMYGCHTGLWDFLSGRPAKGVLEALGWMRRMPRLKMPLKTLFRIGREEAERLGLPPDVQFGTGLHDSSSALVPYLTALGGMFVLVSTGTWIVVLNPDADFRLSEEDLRRDRLYYLTPEKRRVRAARLLAGKEHEVQLQRIERHFGRPPEVAQTAPDSFLPGFFAETRSRALAPATLSGTGPFPGYAAGEWDLSGFASPEEAYARLCLDLAVLVDYCISEVAEVTERIVVDGGFARNTWFVRLLAMLSQPTPLYAAELPEATALGAALVLRAAESSGESVGSVSLPLKLVPVQPVPGLRLYAERLLAHWESHSSN